MYGQQNCIRALGPSSDHGSRAPEWFAVQTRSRHEKSVLGQLHSKEIKAFLPLYRSPKRWNNGQDNAQLPLFPGYLFVRIDIARDQLPILQTSGVARIVSFAGKPASLPDQEIVQLETAVKKGIATPHPFLSIGDRVRIVRGPLAPLSGILIRDKSGFRIVLSVQLIAQSVSVELDACDVEPV